LENKREICAPSGIHFAINNLRALNALSANQSTHLHIAAVTGGSIHPNVLVEDLAYGGQPD
jgi:hypothetical protein